MEEPYGSFLRPDETALAQQYLRDGFVVRDVEHVDSLDYLEDVIRRAVCSHLDISAAQVGPNLLSGIHESIAVEALNELRLYVIRELNESHGALEALYLCGASCLATVVGNELAAQRFFALSVQMPKDSTSLLPAHSDVWSEDSPFEVVLWLPFVDCSDTMSMFLLPPADLEWAHGKLTELQDKGVEKFFNVIRDRVVWPEVRRGQFMVFNHGLVHGNRVNEENATRWSLNGRFKSLFSPYSEKRLGDYFIPITTRPATRLGISYRLPDGFEE